MANHKKILRQVKEGVKTKEEKEADNFHLSKKCNNWRVLGLIIKMGKVTFTSSFLVTFLKAMTCGKCGRVMQCS